MLWDGNRMADQVSSRLQNHSTSSHRNRNRIVFVLSLTFVVQVMISHHSQKQSIATTIMSIIIQIAITIIKLAKVRVHIRRFVPRQRELKWRKEVRISNLRQMSFKAFICCVFIFTQCIFFLAFLSFNFSQYPRRILFLVQKRENSKIS